MKFDYHPCLPSLSLSLSVFLPCRYNYPRSPSRRLPLFSQTPIHTHRNLYRLPSYVSNVLSVARKPPAPLPIFSFYVTWLTLFFHSAPLSLFPFFRFMQIPPGNPPLHCLTSPLLLSISSPSLPPLVPCVFLPL